MTPEQICAIHECGHVVVCYSVGGRIRTGPDSLSIVPKPEEFQSGNSRLEAPWDKKAISDFAGGLAERIANPDQAVTTIAKDIGDILTSCGMFLDQIEGDPFVDAENAYYNDRLRKKSGQPPQEKEAWEAYDNMIQFLVNGSPEPGRNDEFELLSGFAEQSRAYLQRHWSIVEELADRLVKKKVMSGEEVHQILTTQYGFVCEPLP